MRVLVIGFQFGAIGGLEIVSKSIASAVSFHGHDVTCLSLHEAGSYSTDGIRVKGLLSTWKPLRAAQRRLQKYVAAWQLEPLLNAADVVICAHAHVLHFLPTRRLKGKLVCWLHGREVWSPFLEQLAPHLSRVHACVAVSNYTASIVAPKLRPARDIRVIPNPIDTDIFVPAETPAAVRRNHVLTVGRHDADSFHKGYDTLIEAMAVLSKNRPELPVHLTITGTGPLLKQHSDQIQRLGVASRVTLLGRVNRTQLVSLYQTCDVFAFPSRVVEWNGELYGEGFGLVNAEAAACGRPVLTSKDGGCPETVVAGKTGFVVDPRSPSGVAACLETLLDQSAAERDAMGRLGRDFVVSRFSVPVFRDHVGDLLSELRNT